MSAFKNIFINNLENQPEPLAQDKIDSLSENIYQSLLDDLLTHARQPETTHWSVDLDDYVLSYLLTNTDMRRRNLTKLEKQMFYHNLIQHFDWDEDDFYLIKTPNYSHEMDDIDAKSYEAYLSTIHYVENQMRNTHIDKIIWTHYQDILGHKLYFDWSYLAELHTKEN